MAFSFPARSSGTLISFVSKLSFRVPFLSTIPPPPVTHLQHARTYSRVDLIARNAFPDVRDGLKPLHRRILSEMHESAFGSKMPFKKCMNVVYEVERKYHPQKSNTIYNALVGMVQDFCSRSPLIQGQGDFGYDGMHPASPMHFTACRLEPLAEVALLADLDLDTVDFVPNHDHSRKEPSILPARLPAVLLNGSFGIAAGMRTNIPPHNLGELVDVLCALIHSPEATLEELLEHITGPDFPTRGKILGNQGILDAYRTGQGRLVLRGKLHVEVIDGNPDQMAIVITELPYKVNKTLLLKRIAILAMHEYVDVIRSLRDCSGGQGIHIEIELEMGVCPLMVISELYRLTPLQTCYNWNMVCFVDGVPKLMGLKELLQSFLDFRCSAVERRARFKISRALERKHIVEGLLTGIDNSESMIQIIEEAPSDSVASAGLMNEFGLSEKQAEAIVDLNLARMSFLEKEKFHQFLGQREKFLDEIKLLMEEISSQQELLSSRQKILQIIEQEALELKSKFSTPRRTSLVDSDDELVDSDGGLLW